MNSKKTLIVSHAPFWHDGSGIPERSYHTMIAALPAACVGIAYYGAPALGVISLAMASAILWELLLNYASKQPITVGNGNAALIGLLIAMVLPASAPWWLVLIGTFLAIVIGMQIFGGIGANPFNPVALAIAILMVSYKSHLDFDAALVNFSLDFLRWEISIAFIVGVFISAMLFNMSDPVRYAPPAFHLLTGYTLLGAFFLATESSSSPVNFIPMLIYGALGGVMTVLIRNIGAYVDGVIFAILLINLINPLVDKIRPKAIGKVA